VTKPATSSISTNAGAIWDLPSGYLPIGDGARLLKVRRARVMSLIEQGTMDFDRLLDGAQLVPRLFIQSSWHGVRYPITMALGLGLFGLDLAPCSCD